MIDLYYELLTAHNTAATANPNGSLMVAHTVYQASGSMVAALGAASLAQGALHAPIEAARDLLREGVNMGPKAAAVAAAMMLEDGEIVPGFGNSFYKQAEFPRGDPAFNAVEDAIREDFPELSAVVDAIRGANPQLPPANAAMWTACVLEALKMPVGIGPAIFIASRVKAWANSILQAEQQKDAEPSQDEGV
jgi:citrate synthase